jgi:sialic acid synthase SpsE
MLQRLRLSDDEEAAVRDRCAELGVTFLSTPFDEGSARRLQKLGVPAFKVGSGELTNTPLLRLLAGFGKPMIVSTGMATLDEVRSAVEAVADAGDPPLALLHCVSSYPTPADEANLRAMDALRDAFPEAVIGYSDHCLGIEVSLAAVARGAVVLERHVTLDRTLPGPDHAVSLEPPELIELIRRVRLVESALGDGRKSPRDVERSTALVARRSLVAARDLSSGDVLDEAALAVKRPGGGLPPDALDRVQGRTLAKPLRRDEMLTEQHLA